MERIPILKMGEYLLVTIQVDMHDRLAMALQDDLSEKIVRTGAKGVLIDISSLEIVDSFMGRMIGNIAAMSRILDARTVVVGMQPAVAITLVELGLSLPGSRRPSTSNAVWNCSAVRQTDSIERGGHVAIRKAQTLPVRSSEDLLQVRQTVRTWAAEVGFSLVEQTKLITAASELARNTRDSRRRRRRSSPKSSMTEAGRECG